jgi:hypothetical protein
MANDYFAFSAIFRKFYSNACQNQPDLVVLAFHSRPQLRAPLLPTLRKRKLLGDPAAIHIPSHAADIVASR